MTTTLTCQDCGKHIERTGTRGVSPKYCSSCRAARIVARQHAARLARGPAPTVISCADCGIETPRTGRRTVRCPPCRDLRTQTRNVARYDRVRQCWGACTRCGCEVEAGRRVCATCTQARIKDRNRQVSIARAAAVGRVYVGHQPGKVSTRPTWAQRKARETEARRLKAIDRRNSPAAIAKAAADAIRVEAKRVAERRRRQEREDERENQIRLRPWIALPDAEAYLLQYRSDVVFNLKERLRAAFKHTRQGQDLDEHLRPYVNRDAAAHSVEIFVGYTALDLKRHLQVRFTKGMSWAKFLAGEIHINHRVAPTEYDLSDADQLREAWQLPNLRPVWAVETIAARRAVPHRSPLWAAPG